MYVCMYVCMYHTYVCMYSVQLSAVGAQHICSVFCPHTHTYACTYTCIYAYAEKFWCRYCSWATQ